MHKLDAAAQYGTILNHATAFNIAIRWLAKDINMHTPNHAPLLLWASRLGYAGLIPFFCLALTIWLADPVTASWAGVALGTYGATIASFLGAIHWGLAMRTPAFVSPFPLLWGVTPALLAWVALFMPAYAGLLMLTALLQACYAIDRSVYPQHQLQLWLPMRLRLTVVGSGCCLAGAFGLMHT